MSYRDAIILGLINCGVNTAGEIRKYLQSTRVRIYQALLVLEERGYIKRKGYGQNRRGRPAIKWISA